MLQKVLYPQPEFARTEWLNLNGSWAFSFDDPVFDREIQVPYAWGSPLSGIPEEEKTAGWYRKTVSFDPVGERIFLRFGAVDYTCKVSVNGTELGSHKGGYMPFEFEVTSLWNRKGENEITVFAEDTSADCQTYGKQGYGNAKGIWQTPWLEARPAEYLTGLFTKTALDGTVTFEVTAEAADGTSVTADFAGAGTVSAPLKDGKAVLTLKVAEPKLWTPETPFLYEGALSLSTGDRVSTYFGIREIGTGKFGENNRNYITLNGKPYFINGTLDQSFNPEGFFTLPSDADCREEILRLKRIGVNMARIHIKAEEPLKLYWADKLGLLIMADIPCFWGQPLPETRKQFEVEMEQQVIRDRNHPALFYWVVFNETWGLKSKPRSEIQDAPGEYTQDTADWVVSCWKRVKEMDPTRLVEDNSACNYDHTCTDVNTWHFYRNGYEIVRDEIDTFCKGVYPGSSFNFKEGYTMPDCPAMNSECGNVWGVEGNAGDSDISWQYRYMINEFRRQDKLCGFIFTEFHDVVNEFNGYYKIDNSDKDFGYDVVKADLRDLHSQDYLGFDFAPMTAVKPGEKMAIPMFGSSFTALRHGKTLTAEWQLVLRDALEGDRCLANGKQAILWKGYGSFDAGKLSFTFPEGDGVCALLVTLTDKGEKIMSNGLLFDLKGEKKDCLQLQPADFAAEGFRLSFPAMEGRKLNGVGSGEFSAEIRTADIPGFSTAAHLRLVLECSTRPFLTHDDPEAKDNGQGDYMLGYKIDPNANRNSFAQTTEKKHPGWVNLLADGVPFGFVWLSDSPADSRGALSHLYQKEPRHLDEAGSYGTLIDCELPSALLLKLQEKESFTLTLRTESDAGLSLFGRESGRYGVGVVLKAE